MHHHLLIKSFFFKLIFLFIYLPIKNAALNIDIILTTFLALRFNLLVFPVNNAQRANIPPRLIFSFS